jgi:hypothetical protein
MCNPSLANGTVNETHRSIKVMDLFVDVSTMAECDNHDQENSIINGVQNPIVPYSEPISIATSKWPRGRRSRIFGKEGNCPLNPWLRRTVNLSKFSKSRWSEFNPIVAHDQPRSLFTCSQGMLAPVSDSAMSKAAMSCDSSSASSISSYCSGLIKIAARRP